MSTLNKCQVHEGKMSGNEDNHAQNEENMTFFDIEGMSSSTENDPT